MRTRLGLTLVVGALAAPFAGCGGDDEAPVEPIGPTTSTEATASSKDDYIATADSRCAEANSAIANISGTAGTPELAAAQEREITQGTLSSLNQLAPPEDPDGSLSDFLDGLQSQVATLKKQEQAAQSGDTGTFDSLSGELAQDKADTLAAAEQFGFKECGQQGTADSPTPAPATSDTTAVAPTTPTTPAPAPAPAPAPTPTTPPPDTSGGTGTGDTGGTGGGSGGSDGSGSSGGIGPG
jgi:hypothetical protein